MALQRGSKRDVAQSLQIPGCIDVAKCMDKDVREIGKQQQSSTERPSKNRLP